MSGIELFSLVGLIAGILGLSLVIYPVLVHMIKEAFSDETDDKVVAILLPIAKGTYLILMLPVVGYILYVALHSHDQPPGRMLIWGIYGLGVFFNGLSWMLIYTKIVQKSVEWFQTRNKRHI